MEEHLVDLVDISVDTDLLERLQSASESELDFSSESASDSNEPLPPQMHRGVPNNMSCQLQCTNTVSRASLAKHAVYQAHAFHARDHNFPDESYMCSAFHTEVNNISLSH